MDTKLHKYRASVASRGKDRDFSAVFRLYILGRVKTGVVQHTMDPLSHANLTLLGKGVVGPQT